MDKSLILMRKLGLRSTYTGYHYLASAITLTLDDPDYLRHVTKRLYSEVGEIYGVKTHCVEAAIRTMISGYWNLNGDRILSNILGYPLFDKPTASELISMLADYLCEHPEFGRNI